MRQRTIAIVSLAAASALALLIAAIRSCGAAELLVRAQRDDAERRPSSAPADPSRASSDERDLQPRRDAQDEALTRAPATARRALRGTVRRLDGSPIPAAKVELTVPGHPEFAGTA